MSNGVEELVAKLDGIGAHSSVVDIEQHDEGCNGMRTRLVAALMLGDDGHVVETTAQEDMLVVDRARLIEHVEFEAHKDAVVAGKLTQA